MGAISSEIVHLLKVNLSLRNDQRWLLLLSWFSFFFFWGGGFGGEPLNFFFNPTQFNTSLFVKNEPFN